MTNEQINQALNDALVYDAFVKQAVANNVDNCSLLLAVATGKAFSYSEVYKFIYNP